MAEGDSGATRRDLTNTKKAKCVRCNISKYVDQKKWCKECNEVSNPGISENCVKCRSKVRHTDNGLQCDNCLGWYHAGCGQVDQDDFKVFKKSKYVWCCRACSQGTRENLQSLKEMKKTFREIQEENKELKSLLEKHEERLKKLEDTKETIAQIKDHIMEEMKEEEDRRKRKNNLILHRVKEETTEGETARNDVEICNKVFSEVLEVRDVEVMEVKRLGRPNQGKDRPLLVKLSQSETKYAILKQAKNLRRARDQAVANIFISSDMTKKQRDIVFALRNELKEKRDQGDFTWYIDYKNNVLQKKRDLRVRQEQ